MNFSTFAHLHGLIIDRLDVSTRIQRCGTVDKPSSKNGAYLYEGDRGWCQRWDKGGDINWWDDEKPAITEHQRQEWAQRKVDREAAQRALWGATAVRCKVMMDACTLEEHNYLHRKGLGDVRCHVTPAGELFVPMYNVVADVLVGAQLIWWDEAARVWEKKFVHGSRLKGSAMRIGPKTNTEIVLCEGYATGLSIKAALGVLKATVLVCFNDSNLVEVSKLITSGRRYVFADHDKSMAGESAAQATGLNYCMSPVEGEDANDWHQREGIVPVMDAILETRKLGRSNASFLHVDNTSKL